MSGPWFTGFGVNSGATSVNKRSQSNLGQPSAGYTVLRSRLKMRWTIVGASTGGATGFDIDWWQNVSIDFGVCLTNGASSAPNPESPDTVPPNQRWLIWQRLIPRAEVYDLGTPYCQLTAEPTEEVLESFGQVDVPATGVSALWLAWNVLDPSGLIGTTTAGFIKWSLGYNYAYRWLQKPTGS